ncbi:MAG TPA: hypothetical protein VHE83_07245 [Mycobacteriales bacterium]|nr:hypothetical protein [Mycobacteriales bacterium]
MNKARLLAVAPMATFALLALPTAAFAAASVTVSPSNVGASGGSVTVTGAGFGANKSLVVVECANLSGQAGCDITNLGSATSDASGAFTTTFNFKTGTIGNGTCNAGDTCYVTAADPTNPTDKTNQAVAKITVGAASSSSGSGSTSTPTAVAAGSGGGADRNGTPVGVIVLASIGGLALAGGAVRLARR